MISSDLEVAIDEVNETCTRAADHYGKFAELIDDPELEQLVLDLSRRRRRFCERLHQQIRAMDHLPSAPDPDREGLERLAARFRAVLSGGGMAGLVTKCREMEEELIASIEGVSRRRVSGSLGALLDEMRQDAEEARRRLGEQERRHNEA